VNNRLATLRLFDRFLDSSLLVMVLAIFFGGCGVNAPATEESRRKVCRSNLNSIAMMCKIYSEENSGKYPDALSDLYPDYVSSLMTFTCPNDPTTISSGKMIDSCASYVLVPGLTDQTDKNAVLLREKPGLHEGGIHVVDIGGSIRWVEHSIGTE